jgi:hypothetical protein
VRVIVLYSAAAEPEAEEIEWLHSAAHNPAFSFLNDPEEDIYTPTDGAPISGPFSA